VLIRLCRLGVNLHWFLTGEGPIARASSGFAQPLPLVSEKKPAQIDSPDGTLYRVPLVRVTADGNGTPQLEEVSTVDWMDEASIQWRYGAPPDQLKGFRISGDAMTETLSPGSRVIGALWRGESLVDGAVYLFYCTSGVLVRRVRLKEDTVMLTAEQSGAPDLSFDVGVWSDQLRPIAHLLEAIRSL